MTGKGTSFFPPFLHPRPERPQIFVVVCSMAEEMFRRIVEITSAAVGAVSINAATWPQCNSALSTSPTRWATNWECLARNALKSSAETPDFRISK